MEKTRTNIIEDDILSFVRVLYTLIYFSYIIPVPYWEQDV